MWQHACARVCLHACLYAYVHVQHMLWPCMPVSACDSFREVRLKCSRTYAHVCCMRVRGACSFNDTGWTAGALCRLHTEANPQTMQLGIDGGSQTQPVCKLTPDPNALLGCFHNGGDNRIERCVRISAVLQPTDTTHHNPQRTPSSTSRAHTRKLDARSKENAVTKMNRQPNGLLLLVGEHAAPMS